jgi:hypothetical protein
MPPIVWDENDCVEVCVLRRHEGRIRLSAGDWDVSVTLSSRDPGATYGVLPEHVLSEQPEQMEKQTLATTMQLQSLFNLP